MAELTLLYFDGCPNAITARKNLADSGLKYKEIRQDGLLPSDPLKSYSSPTILNGDELLFGTKTGPEGGCSLEVPTASQLREKFNSAGFAKKAGALAPTGSIASILTVILCPVCKPAIAVFLSTVGLGFVVRESVLRPLLMIFLALTVAGLGWSYFKVHRNFGPLVVGAVMCAGLYLGRYVYFGDLENQFLTYGSIAGLLAVSIWNFRLKPPASCDGGCSTKNLEA
jgi:hypothetical protein